MLHKEIDLAVLDITERWKEIDQRDQQAGRFVPWLYVFLAALAGFVFSDATDGAAVLASQPYLLAVVALILLWFPINGTVVWNDVLNCETYLRARAFPRLAALLIAQRELVSLPAGVASSAIDPVWSVFEWKPFWHRAVMIDRRGRLPLILWRVKDLAPHVPSLVLAAIAATIAVFGIADTGAWPFWVTAVLVVVYAVIHVAAVLVAHRIGRLLHEASLPD